MKPVYKERDQLIIDNQVKQLADYDELFLSKLTNVTDSSVAFLALINDEYRQSLVKQFVLSRSFLIPTHFVE